MSLTDKIKDEFKEYLQDFGKQLKDGLEKFTKDKVVETVENVKAQISGGVQKPKDDSKEGWIVLREKVVEYIFEIIVIFAYFFPDWKTPLVLSFLLGFKLFGAYLGKLFQNIIKQKDNKLMDKDTMIQTQKDVIDKQAQRIYLLEAKLNIDK